MPGVLGGSDPEGSPATKLCVYCLAILAPAATVCPGCKFRQSKWKNRLLFVSGIASLLSVFVSGVAFTVTNLSEFYKKNYGKESVIIHDFGMNFASSFEVTLANPGDEDIYVSGMLVTWSAGSTNISIGKTVRAHAFLHVNQHDDVPNMTPVRLETRILALSNPPDYKKLYRIAKFVEISELNGINDQNKDLPCIWTGFRSTDAPDLEHMAVSEAAMGKKLVLDHATGVVEFFTPRQAQKQRVEADLFVIFWFKGARPVAEV